jgi:hypothetical protein
MADTAAPVETTLTPETAAPTTEPTDGGGDDLTGLTELSDVTVAVDDAGTVTVPDAALDCEGGDLGIPGYTTVGCGGSIDMLVLTLRRVDTGQWVAAVLKEQGPTWVSVFVAIEPEAGVWDNVDFRIGEYGAGEPTAFIGYRYAGSGGFLDIDVVQAVGPGFLKWGYQGLENGNFASGPDSELLFTQTVALDTDPLCCPSVIEYREVRYAADAWRIAVAEPHPIDAAPVISTAF